MGGAGSVAHDVTDRAVVCGMSAAELTNLLDWLMLITFPVCLLAVYVLFWVEADPSKFKEPEE